METYSLGTYSWRKKTVWKNTVWEHTVCEEEKTVWKKRVWEHTVCEEKNSLEKIQFRIFVVVALQRQVTQSEPYSAFLNEGVMGKEFDNFHFMFQLVVTF